jgi:hypothetical protein
MSTDKGQEASPGDIFMIRPLKYMSNTFIMIVPKFYEDPFKIEHMVKKMTYVVQNEVDTIVNPSTIHAHQLVIFDVLTLSISHGL